jgi:hypothetical protein
MDRMTTRLARQMDALRVRRVAANSIAVVEPTPLDDPRALTSALLVPGGEKVWITEDSSGAVGVAQARPRRYVFGWELVRVQVRRNRDEDLIVAELVQEVLQYLQDRGIPRLFARTPEGADGQGILIRCGFMVLLAETVFVRRPMPARSPATTPAGLRYRMREDDWPVRQLERSQTPPLINQLEGLTSSSWSAARARVLHRNEQTDLIIERDGDIVGWAGWSFVGANQRLREHARLSLLTDIDHSDLASPLLDYALYAINSKRPNAQVIVRLRDYQESLQSALFDHDFDEGGRESLLIKHGRLEAVSKPARKLFELAPAQRTALSIERARGF